MVQVQNENQNQRGDKKDGIGPTYIGSLSENAKVFGFLIS
jgi:hypothetical protein